MKSYKEASIEWILSVGELEPHFYRNTNTAEALYVLAKRGIDFDQSTEPYFGQIVKDPSDSFNDAVTVKGITASIIPLGGDYRDSYTFILSEEMLMGEVIKFMALMGSQEGSAWKTRYAEDFARFEQMEQEDRVREEARRAAFALQKSNK